MAKRGPAGAQGTIYNVINHNGKECQKKECIYVYN